MFEPVTITSSIVTPGWPVVCGVGNGFCANVTRIGQKKAAVIAKHRPMAGGFISGHSCREVPYNRGNKSSYPQTSIVLKIRRQTTAAGWGPDLTEEPADPGPEKGLAIPAEPLAHLVTGRRNTLGQLIRHIGVRQVKALGSLDGCKLR